MLGVEADTDTQRDIDRMTTDRKGASNLIQKGHRKRRYFFVITVGHKQNKFITAESGEGHTRHQPGSNALSHVD
ncbi:hypothetical protein D3C80_1105710 [compost metagenome]